MNPYREPGQVAEFEGADDDMYMYLEERISDRYMNRRKLGFKGYALVYVNPGDFQQMARRLAAKVEEHSESGLLSVTLHTGAGKAVVLADSDVPTDRMRLEMVARVEVFAAGDVVKLKSSPTPMTVYGYDHDHKVKCIWFEMGTIARGLFHEAVLERGTT